MVMLWPCHSQWPSWHGCKNRGRFHWVLQPWTTVLWVLTSSSPLLRETHDPSDPAGQTFICIWCSPMQFCEVPHSHCSGEPLAAWEVVVHSYLGVIPASREQISQCMWCRGSGPRPGGRDRVPTCWLSLCPCCCPVLCCSLSFLTIPSMTAAIGRLWFCNQGRKKKRNCWFSAVSLRWCFAEAMGLFIG